MTVPKSGDLGSCHCEARSAEAISRPAPQARPRLHADTTSAAADLRRLPYNDWLREPCNDEYQGWKGLPSDAGMLTRIHCGLREISASTTMVAI